MSQEIEAYLTASTQQTEVIATAFFWLLCLICLDHDYDDFSFIMAVYNMVHHTTHVPSLLPLDDRHALIFLVLCIELDNRTGIREDNSPVPQGLR